MERLQFGNSGPGLPAQERFRRCWPRGALELRGLLGRVFSSHGSALCSSTQPCCTHRGLARSLFLCPVLVFKRHSRRAQVYSAAGLPDFGKGARAAAKGARESRRPPDLARSEWGRCEELPRSTCSRRPRVETCTHRAACTHVHGQRAAATRISAHTQVRADAWRGESMQTHAHSCALTRMDVCMRACRAACAHGSMNTSPCACTRI